MISLQSIWSLCSEPPFWTLLLYGDQTLVSSLKVPTHFRSVLLMSSQISLPSFPEDNNTLFKEGNKEFSSCSLYFMFRTALAPAYKAEPWPTTFLRFYHSLTFPTFRAQLYNVVLNACSSYVILSCPFGYPFKTQKHRKHFYWISPPSPPAIFFWRLFFQKGEKGKSNRCSPFSPSSDGTQAGWRRKNNQQVLLQGNFCRCLWRETVQLTTWKSFFLHYKGLELSS